MKSVIGSTPIGSTPFTIRVVPGTPSAITGLRLTNESSATLQIDWGGEAQVLHPATVDVFKSPPRPTSDITVTPLNVFPAGASATGVLMVESALAPDKWDGSYPMALPPGVINVGTVSGNVNIGNNVPVINPPGLQLATYQQGQLLTPQYQIAPNTNPAAKLVTIQPGMQVMSIYMWNPTAGNVRVRAVGLNTGFVYWSGSNTFGTGAATPIRFLVDQAFENQINVSIDTTGPLPIITVPVNVNILGGPNPVEQLTANIQDSSGAQILADNYQNMGVTHQYARAAPWQAATNSVEFTVGGGANAVIIPAPAANVYIWVHHLRWDTVTQVGLGSWMSGRFRPTTSATPQLERIENNHQAGWGLFQGPIRLPIGEGLQYEYIFGTAANINGRVSYTPSFF